jgi:hypothetical protein
VGMLFIIRTGRKNITGCLKVNEFGISQLTFPVENYEPRSIDNVKWKSECQGEKAKGKTWFRLWW